MIPTSFIPQQIQRLTDIKDVMTDMLKINYESDCFDDIRPYHDQSLFFVYEELIADPAFQKAVLSIMPGCLSRLLRRKCVLAVLS